MRRKIIVTALLLSVMLIVAVLGLVWGTLSASLPTLDGNLEAPGLERPVEVDRDSLSIPTIRGENRKDIAMQPDLYTHRIVSFRWIPCANALPVSLPNFSGNRLLQPIARHEFTVSWFKPRRNLMRCHKEKRNFSKPTQRE